MSLWDFLKPNNNNNNGNGLFSQIFNRNNMQQAKPELEPIQLDTVTGEKDPVLTAQTELARQQQTKPLKLGDRLFGRDLTMDVQKINPETGETELTTVVNSKPGFFTDMTNGMNENFKNEFKPENWRGQNRGFAYRLGEGLGSAARGLSGWAGDAWTAGHDGLDAGLGRQAIRTGDQLYRKQLKDDYGYTDEDLNNVKGYIDKDTFNSLTKSQNSAMNLALKQQTTQSMNKLRELQAEKLRIQNSTLPEEQKLRLMKLNAEATHAEEMQLARINYYNNSASLGWANFGLRANEDQRKAEMDAMKKDLMKELTGNDGTGAIQTADKPKGRAF
jgi:hypothetical protein